jgi:hypothetical protein
MTTYHVRLFKRVSNDIGCETRALQREFQVEAFSDVDALKAAKAQFCSLLRVSDCSFYTDTFEVERMSWSECEGDGQNPTRVISLSAALR